MSFSKAIISIARVIWPSSIASLSNSAPDCTVICISICSVISGNHCMPAEAPPEDILLASIHYYVGNLLHCVSAISQSYFICLTRADPLSSANSLQSSSSAPGSIHFFRGVQELPVMEKGRERVFRSFHVHQIRHILNVGNPSFTKTTKLNQARHGIFYDNQIAI